MDIALNRVYEALAETLYVDLKKARPLSSDQLQRFRDYFAMGERVDGLYYNDFNLIIADRQTFDELQNFIKGSAITTRFESIEHNLFVVVYPYFNDALIRQALE